MKSVLVLNAGYEPLHRVSVQHAIRMIVREVAVIEESDNDQTFGTFPLPKVLRLLKYIRMNWRGKSPRFSKSKLFLRDNYQCGYCGKLADTVDHVIPRSRGGTTTWSNTVASCIKCNRKKGNKTLEDANMKLRIKPFEPDWLLIA
jgi:hypothetical protein